MFFNYYIRNYAPFGSTLILNSPNSGTAKFGDSIRDHLINRITQRGMLSLNIIPSLNCQELD